MPRSFHSLLSKGKSSVVGWRFPFFNRVKRVKVAFVCGYGEGGALLYTHKFRQALKAYGLGDYVLAEWRGISHDRKSGNPLSPRKIRGFGVQKYDYAVFRQPDGPKIFDAALPRKRRARLIFADDVWSDSPHNVLSDSDLHFVPLIRRIILEHPELKQHLTRKL